MANGTVSIISDQFKIILYIPAVVGAAVVGGAVVAAAVVGGAVVAAVVGGAVVGGAVVAAVVACVIPGVDVVVVATGCLPTGGGLVTICPSDSRTSNRGTMLRTSILLPTSTDMTWGVMFITMSKNFRTEIAHWLADTGQETLETIIATVPTSSAPIVHP